MSLLLEKVSNALTSISDGKITLTWKQRSVYKKQGWGACNSLGLILQSDMAREDENRQSSLQALELLVLWVEQCYSLNEKVAVAAMSAINAMDVTTLAEVAGNNGLIGTSIITCLLNLYEVRVGATKRAQIYCMKDLAH